MQQRNGTNKREPGPLEQRFPQQVLQNSKPPYGIYDSSHSSTSSSTGIPESRLLSKSKKKNWKFTFSSFSFHRRSPSYAALCMCVTGLFLFFRNTFQAQIYTIQNYPSSSVITATEILDEHSYATNVFPSIVINNSAPESKIREDDSIVLPPFNILPSPGSMCHSSANSTTSNNLKSYCKNKNKCMKHKKENLLQTINRKGDSNDNQGNKESDTEGCKMLWFVAMHESEEECNSSTTSGKMHHYTVDYSVALNSALKNARDTLQPVLILGRYGTSYENSTEPKKFGRWAEAKGVKVVYSPRLSFQEDVDKGFRKLENVPTDISHRQGPFLRLDIPKMIKEHSLLDLPNTCKSHVLYTDADVIFANEITNHDIQLLLESVGQGIASYGREKFKKAGIFNTGVMVINVKRLDEEMPKIVQHAKTEDKYPQHDQQMLNWYREKNDQAYEEFSLLPMQYNWKAYWGLEPSTFSEVKIIHFHGPKLHRGLDEMALCDVDAIISNSSSMPEAYHPLIREGVCCDQGRTARWSMDAIKNLRAPMKDLCDDRH